MSAEPFSKGSLWSSIVERTEAARATGALLSIPTRWTTLREGELTFVVRVVENLARKKQAVSSTRNPFLPYDRALFVADASETHVCLLNKFNVVDHHLLIVTRELEDQRALLNLQDFSALWRCLQEFGGLGFYNGGREAGASQPHKHLQIAPLPLNPRGPPIPIEPLLEPPATPTLNPAAALPFHHAAVVVGDLAGDDEAAATLLGLYHSLLSCLDSVEGIERDLRATVDEAQPFPYNLLLTRHWMMLVPRLRESYHSIEVNALGLTGAFLARDAGQVDVLRREGPLRVLAEVALARR